MQRFANCWEFLKYLVIVAIAYSVIPTVHAYTDLESTATSGLVGNYFGLQVGRTSIQASQKTLPNVFGLPVVVNPSSGGAGVRLYTGYQFSKYAAFEGGYTYYSSATYNIPNGNSPEIGVQAVDFLGVGLYPLFNNLFNVYGKAGFAVALFRVGGLLAPATTKSVSGNSGMSLRPEVAVGVSYSFSPNWIIDFSASRILSGGYVPNTTLIAVGISYRMVDLYCGQFLC